MASLHRRKNSKYHYARVKLWNEALSDYCWRSLTTGVKDDGTKENRKLALDLAIEMEKVSKMGKSMACASIDIEKFEHLIESILATAGVVVSKGGEWPSIEDYIDGYLEKLKTRVKAGTIDSYTTTKKHFIDWIEEQGASSAKMDWMTPARCDSYYSACLGSLTTKTSRERVKFLSRVYDDAVTFHEYPSDPFEAIKKSFKNSTSKQVSEKLERMPLSLEEVGVVLDYLKSQNTDRAEDWRKAVYIGLMSGCRIGDAVSMHSDNIVDGVIRYQHDKTGKETACPMVVDDWKNELEPLTGYLCPLLQEEFAKNSTAQLSSEFTEIVKRAGVEQKYHKFASGRTIARKTFHSLRHTLRSSIVSSGGSDAQADLILGHSEGQGKTYTHADMKSMRKVLKSALKGV